MVRTGLLGVSVLAAGLLLASCAHWSDNKPILPVREYERMLAGRLDAEYVGTDNCVARCHTHDKLTDDFKHSVHGAQIKFDSGLPLVNCESCHGPGSLAIAALSEDAERNTAEKKKCDTTTLLDYKQLPPQALSLICLKCHSAASTPILTHWNAGSHALNDVTCLDCHKLHHGPQQKVRREEMAALCYGCHPEIRAQNNLYSHHPMIEKRMSCADCHNPHGTVQDHMLRGMTSKDTCTRCHGDKQGPFAFEHGDVTEDCGNCHTPHGSVNARLLKVTQPFLCLQCHAGHTLSTTPGVKRLFTNRCSDCHSQIHGSDIPSPSTSAPGTMRQ